MWIFEEQTVRKLVIGVEITCRGTCFAEANILPERCLSQIHIKLC